MAEINRRTSLVTASLGSGAEADIILLLTSDICGETARLPRHARARGNLAALQKAIRDARIEALTGFRKEVAGGSYSGRRRSCRHC